MKCKIVKDFWTRQIQFLFYEDSNGVLKQLKHVGSNWEMVVVNKGEPLEPTISVPRELDDDYAFLKVLTEELASLGHKANNDARLEGELVATKFHLADLRQLLKLEKTPSPTE